MKPLVEVELGVVGSGDSGFVVVEVVVEKPIVVEQANWFVVVRLPISEAN